MSKSITRVAIEAETDKINIDDVYTALKPFIKNLIKIDISNEELPF